MLIRESFTNETKGYRFGDSEPYEPYTDNIGKLFRSLSKEYGRCKSAVYIDKKDGGRIKVGWYFEKRMRYEDARDSWPKKDQFYVRGVWVELLERKDEVTRESFPLELK